MKQIHTFINRVFAESIQQTRKWAAQTNQQNHAKSCKVKQASTFTEHISTFIKQISKNHTKSYKIKQIHKSAKSCKWALLSNKSAKSTKWALLSNKSNRCFGDPFLEWIELISFSLPVAVDAARCRTPLPKDSFLGEKPAGRFLPPNGGV